MRATLRYVNLSRILAMTKHHTAWIHFSPQLVLILLTGLQKDPFLHSGERVEGRKKKPCTRLIFIVRISFLNSNPSSSIETSQAECSFLGLCLRTLVTLKLWAGQTHLQPNRVALHQSEPPYPLMILPQKPTTGYLWVAYEWVTIDHSTLGGKDTTSNNHCQFFRITNGPAL